MKWRSAPLDGPYGSGRTLRFFYSNSNSELQYLRCCHHGTGTARVHPVHMMNVAPTFGPSLKHRSLKLYRPKAGTHFTIPE